MGTKDASGYSYIKATSTQTLRSIINCSFEAKILRSHKCSFEAQNFFNVQ
jgi:hypothetical protein